MGLISCGKTRGLIIYTLTNVGLFSPSLFAHRRPGMRAYWGKRHKNLWAVHTHGLPTQATICLVQTHQSHLKGWLFSFVVWLWSPHQYGASHLIAFRTQGLSFLSSWWTVGPKAGWAPTMGGEGVGTRHCHWMTLYLIGTPLSGWNFSSDKLSLFSVLKKNIIICKLLSS